MQIKEVTIEGDKCEARVQFVPPGTLRVKGRLAVFVTRPDGETVKAEVPSQMQFAKNLQMFCDGHPGSQDRIAPYLAIVMQSTLAACTPLAQRGMPHDAVRAMMVSVARLF